MKLPYFNLMMMREHKYWATIVIVIPVVLVLGIAIGGYYIARDYLNSFQWVEDTYQVLDDMNCVQALLVNSESSVRGYILSGDDKFLVPYYRAKENIPVKMERLKEALSSCPCKHEDLKVYASLVESKMAMVDAAVARRLGKSPNSAPLLRDKLIECQEMTEQIREISKKMRDNQIALLKKKQGESSLIAKKLLILTSALVGVLLLFIILLFVLFEWLKRLRSLVTVCSMTHKVLYDGDWITMEQYLENRFGLNVSHGISEDAARRIIEEIRVKHNGSQSPPPMSES